MSKLPDKLLFTICQEFIRGSKKKKNQYSTVLLSSQAGWKTLTAKWRDQRRNRFIKKTHTPILTMSFGRTDSFWSNFWSPFAKAITFNGWPRRWEASRRKYKEKNAEFNFLFSAVWGKEIPAVNVDNLQTFKPDFLPTLNDFANQDKQNHFLLWLPAAGREQIGLNFSALHLRAHT